MFRIGEFSSLVRVSARMLRYYDKCGLLHPARIDDFTGYRLYSAAQIPRLNQIITLRDMGFGVEEIERILPYYNDKDKMQAALTAKRREIHETIASEQDKLERIAALCGALEKERNIMIYDVELKNLAAVKVLSLCEVIPAYDQEGILWEKLGKFMAAHNVDCNQGGYSIYHNDEYKESDVEVEVAVPVNTLGESQAPFVYKELPAIPNAATIRFSGPYEGYTASMEKLGAWMEANGYSFAGPIRGLAVASPSDVGSPDDYLTELQVPVRKA